MERIAGETVEAQSNLSEVCRAKMISSVIKVALFLSGSITVATDTKPMTWFGVGYVQSLGLQSSGSATFFTDSSIYKCLKCDINSAISY